VKRFAGLSLALLLLAACGGGSSGSDALGDARDSLVGARFGQLLISLDAGDAGFRVSGPFDYADSADHAVLELEYEHHDAKGSAETKVISTGTAGWVQQGAIVSSLTPAQLESLRWADGHSGAVPELRLDEWVEDASEDGNRISGKVDAEALVEDLAALAADIDGRKAPSSVDDPGDVSSSSVIVETSGDDHAFRSVRVDVTFDEVTPALSKALGSYAAKRLVLRVGLTSIKRPLEVKPPH
jgi:hypothetical protein